MSCEAREAELLQPLAAGTLAEDEREAVLRHVSSCQECPSELDVLREMVGDLRTLHLTPVELVEAAWSGARPEHLQDCGTCREELDTLGRVNLELLGRSRSWGVPHALAASVLVAAVGLAAWNRDLRERSATTAQGLAVAEARLATTEARLEQLARETPAPHVNVPIVDLEPALSSRGGAGPKAQLLEFPPGVGSATLILVTRPMRPHDSYALEVLDASGRPVWKSEGLVRSAYDTLTLTIPRSLLPAGSYRYVLDGFREGERERVEEYAVVVRHR